MNKDVLNYLNNKLSKKKGTTVKNTSKVFKKALVLVPAVVATIAMLTGCGNVDDRVITDEEANGVNFSYVDQEELSWNRYFGKLLGVDRGNIFGEGGDISDYEEEIQYEDVILDNNFSQDATIPSYTEPVISETVPSENDQDNTTNNGNSDYSYDDNFEETVEDPNNQYVPQEKPTEPENTTPTQPEAEETPSEEVTENNTVLNNFDVFVQTYLMITGQESANAKFISITPVLDNVNGTSHSRPYYFMDDSFSPNLQPGMTFSTQVYTGTITAEVNGKIVTIKNVAMGVEELETIFNILGSSKFELTQDFINNLPNSAACAENIGSQVYTPITIGRDTIANSGNDSAFQQLLDTIVAANANCIELRSSNVIKKLAILP